MTNKNHKWLATILMAILATCACVASEGRRDVIQIHLDDMTYKNIRCEGCNKTTFTEFNTPSELFVPLYNQALAIWMRAVPVESGIAIDFRARISGEVDFANASLMSDIAQLLEIVKNRDFSSLGKKRIIIPKGQSRKLTFGDIEYRVYCIVPEMVALPELPVVEDDEGNRIHGTVQIAAEAGEDGSVQRVNVLHSDDPRLNRATEEAVRKAKFVPQSLDGEPMNFDVIFKASFEEENSIRM